MTKVRADKLTVGNLVDQFLAAQKIAGSPATYYWYARYLNSFRCHAAGEKATAVTGSKVRTWVQQNFVRHSDSTKNTAERSVVRMLNWAYNEQLMTVRPLRGFRKTRPDSRVVIISSPQYAHCIRDTQGSLRQAIKVLWHSGARPQELRVLRAEWINGQKFVIPKPFTKRKRKDEALYLDSMAMKIVSVYAREYPQGPIFRNSRGKAWTKDGLSQAFSRLRKRTGIKGLCAYALRHAWITRMLEKGVDVVTVAAMARTSPRMIMEVYCHVDQNEARLLSKLG